MPFISVYIHFVWATKRRIPFLRSRSLRAEVWKHIHAKGREAGIHVDFVGGYDDHCHCLVSMTATQTMAEVMRRLKGESSRFINHSGMCPEGFAWQSDYYAAAVQYERVKQVRNYIRQQETHHGAVPFVDEYRGYLEAGGFTKFRDDFE